MHRVIFGDNLNVLRGMEDQSVSLIYIDPPFNTGRDQKMQRIRSIRDEEGNRVGFSNRRYRSESVSSMKFSDTFENFMEFLQPRLEEAHRVLAHDGSLFLHVDYREVHYCRFCLDEVFGRDNFQNEIIWAYDYGGRSKRRWPAKHDNILWYSKHASNYVYNYDAIDRVPYMAPALVGKEKAARGKVPTDVWWNTIVPTNGHERTGYPTQKPLQILERIVRVHSNPGDVVLDFFAGSGTTGEAAARHGRRFVLVDQNPEAISVIEKRLAFMSNEIAFSKA